MKKNDFFIYLIFLFLFQVSSSQVIWTGAVSNEWRNKDNWSSNSVPVFTDVIIPSGLTNYPTADALFVNSITFESGTSFIFDSTFDLPAGIMITYEREVSNSDWHLMSSPVENQTFEALITENSFATGTNTNIGVGIYNNSNTLTWEYKKNNSTGNITNGTGMAIKSTLSSVFFKGEGLNTNDITLTTGSKSITDFDLIGNPYTAYLNSSSFLNNSTNASSLSEQTIWIWDGSSYITKNLIEPIEIAPTQGFFIASQNAGDKLNLLYTMVSHQTTDTFMRQVPKTSFELFVESEDIKTSTKVFYIDGKTTGHDNGYDSKMFGGVTQELAVFTELLENNEGKKLAIQTLPNENFNSMIIPIGLIAKAGKEVNFSTNPENLPTGIEIYLEDRVNKTFTNLSKEDFTITLKNKTEGAGQFYIHTSSKNLSTEDIVKSRSDISIYKSSERTITLTGLLGEASVGVYSLLGEELITKKLNSNGNSKMELSNLSRGIYAVKLSSKLGTITKKIILD